MADSASHIAASAAQLEFIEGFSRRLSGLREGLDALRKAPADRGAREQLERRLHAVGTAAKVLGLGAAADAIFEAARLLAQAGRGAIAKPELETLTRLFELLPSLLTKPAAPAATLLRSTTPLTVLVFGPAWLAEGVTHAASRIDCWRTEDFTQAVDYAQGEGPDAVLVDSGARGAKQLVQALSRDPLVTTEAILVVAAAGEGSAAPWVSAGARAVLTLPLGPEELRQAIARHAGVEAPGALSSGIGRVDLETLSRKIAEEIRYGLVDAAQVGDDASVDLGAGSEIVAAVWGAVARVRKVVSLASEGAIEFRQTGPEGSLVLDSVTGRKSARQAGDLSSVELKGRSVVVADDDPAIVWLLSDALRAVGMRVFEAHDGERALELVEEHYPDALVADVVMPKLDGLELCRKLKHDLALRGLPVILLSWKEDLLARVRELGVKADGYLRKESEASVLVDRLREALCPRARVEARLATGASVSGRIDGLTPVWLLQAARKHLPNARVQLRDAAYLYEVELRNSEPVTATRVTASGEKESGVLALRGFLGVSAGRFEVSSEQHAVSRTLLGSLDEQLAPLLRKARATARSLSEAALLNLQQVVLEPAMVGAYRDVSPPAVRELLGQLLAGSSPRTLVLSGSVTPSALGAVLWDLHSHGAVRELVSFADTASDGDTTSSGFSFLLSPEPPAARALPLAAPSPSPVVASATAVSFAGSPMDAPAPLLLPEPSPMDLAAALVSACSPSPPHANVKEPDASVPEAIAEPAPVEPFAARLEALDAAVVEPVVTEPPPSAVMGAEAEAKAPAPSLQAAAAPPVAQAEVFELSPSFAAVQAEAVGDHARAVAEAFNPTSPAASSPRGSESAESAPPWLDDDAVSPEPPPVTRERLVDEVQKRVVRWSKATLPVAAAALGSFALVRYLIVPSLEPRAPQDEAAASAPPSAVSGAAPAPTVAAPARPPSIDVLEPPKEIPLPKGLGLLLVETGARHSLYLDGDFIGVGPRRYAQLPPGTHEVKLRLGGEEQSFSVEVSENRMVRLRPPGYSDEKPEGPG